MTSSIVSRCRRITSPIGSPPRITMTGVPRMIGRRRGHRHERVRQGDGQQGEDADREKRGGERVVLLGHGLLDEVAHRHVDEQLERGDLGEAGPADDRVTSQRNVNTTSGAEDDLHQAEPPLCCDV